MNGEVVVREPTGWAIASARVAVFVVTVVAAGVAQAPPPATPEIEAIDLTRVLADVRALASDEFEGRFPGSRGEERTVAFVAEQFRKAGLQPAGTGGSWFQPVPLVGITGQISPLTLRRGTEQLVLQPKDDVVAWTKRAVGDVSLEASELVFVGYGVEAPEARWDDYKGVDLTGKTMVVLIGDPPVPDPSNPSRLDPAVFGGAAMTWYGRWVYKYDIGAAKRAAGVLIVHEAGPAGYGFSIVQGRLGEQFDLRTADRNVGRPAVEGWVTLARARQLFAMAGHDFDALKRRAATRDFTPVPLGVTASISIRNTLRDIDSRNVAGVLPGGDAARRDEHVAFTAHWDAFGVGPAIDGETIRHGALDNATGVAGLIELARVFAALPQRPARSLLFLAVTAEEQGLLGSDYYTRSPLVPLERTLAVLNFEMLNVYGRTRDLIVYGLGASELDEYAAEAAARQRRVPKPDPAAEQGWYYRSDHFPFARRGVPAIWASGGDDFIGKPAGYGKRVRDEYVAVRYHKPADEVRDEWDLGGAREDLAVYFRMGQRLAAAERFPEWKPGAEFRAKREEMLRARPR